MRFVQSYMWGTCVFCSPGQNNVSEHLLGAPLSSENALQQCLKARTSELQESLSKLILIAKQDALLILRSSLGAPKMIHVLRGAVPDDFT